MKKILIVTSLLITASSFAQISDQPLAVELITKTVSTSDTNLSDKETVDLEKEAIKSAKAECLRAGSADVDIIDSRVSLDNNQMKATAKIECTIWSN